MADLRHGFLLIEEVPDNTLKVGVVPDVLGRPPSWDHQRDVVGGVNVCKTQVG